MLFFLSFILKIRINWNICDSALSRPIPAVDVLWSPFAEHGLQLKIIIWMWIWIIFSHWNCAIGTLPFHLKCPEKGLRSRKTRALVLHFLLKGICVFTPAQHCTNSDKNIYLLNQQTSLLSALWTLPSKCSPGPNSFSSSDLSRLHRGTWKVCVVSRCINLLNIHIPAVNRLYSEHWQRPSQEFLLLLDLVSSLLSYRDFLGLPGNQNRLQTFSLKKPKENKLKKPCMNAGTLRCSGKISVMKGDKWF